MDYQTATLPLSLHFQVAARWAGEDHGMSFGIARNISLESQLLEARDLLVLVVHSIAVNLFGTLALTKTQGGGDFAAAVPPLSAPIPQ